jgi:lipopolysaccharide export system permease protein
MHLSPTLSRYMGRQFLWTLAGAFLLIIGLIFILDVVELLRRATSSRADASFGIVLKMALYKLPHMAEKAVPFAVLFGSMATFRRLTRSAELVVARAAGVSVWNILLPIVIIAGLIGIFGITVFNPLSSLMLFNYEQMEGKYIKGRASLLALSSSGLWLRQADSKGQSVVHAMRVNQKNMELQDVIIFLYEGTDRFSGRIDAPTARLEDGYWLLREAWITAPDTTSRFAAEMRLPTELTVAKIQDSFSLPETMSFWQLPGFINLLEEAGFSAVRHRLYWHSLLASPFILCAMVLIAATFALRPALRKRTAVLIVGGVFAGFLVNFLTDIVFALGLSGNVPVVLAAWTPAGVCIFLGLAALLHLEDG